jgi:molybdopterin synthase catalytic subunit
MVVRVRLFAILRERAGTGELELELPDGARVSDAVARVGGLPDGLHVLTALNREYVRDDPPLSAGDELALIPPVSGGAAAAVDRLEGRARITEAPLSLDRLIALVRDPRAGAVVTFQGVTRDVPRLEYEAYTEMAIESIAEIVEAAIERHGLCAAAAEHRIGTVPLSEPSVAVAVSAPHRGEAFAGAREIIDELKARAPIWKREVEADGTATWIHPSEPTPPQPEG